tara:strand:+ start:187 stop:585 length:399 start_codon:yes stop_codon:yes gene_type:complete
LKSVCYLVSAIFAKICYGEIVKKLILYVILGLIFCNIGSAEKYVCSYLFNEKPESVVFERSGNFFNKSNGAKNEIVFEDEHAIVLTNTYTGLDDYKPSTYSTIIDKKKLNFVFVGLEYQNSSAIVEGKCESF